MKILIAEDEEGISMTYDIMLKDRGHQVTITTNGVECLKAYGKEIYEMSSGTSREFVLKSNQQPFDVVVLDYRMPKMDGMEAAKAIFKINPHQRIIFASAYVMSTLEESVKNLGRVVELIQKPFELDALADMIEDRTIFEELKKINVNVEKLRGLNPTHDQIMELLMGLKGLYNDASKNNTNCIAPNYR